MTRWKRTEEEAIITAYSLYLQTPHPAGAKFKFTFRAYRFGRRQEGAQ